jgi:hypothetical protein
VTAVGVPQLNSAQPVFVVHARLDWHVVVKGFGVPV